MQTWEYKRIIGFFRTKRETYDLVQYAFSNSGPIMENVDSSVFFDYINKQGKEGWEMINGSSHQGDRVHVETYFFKRPIE